MPVPETRAPGLQLIQEAQTLSQPRPKCFQSAAGVCHRANSNVAVAVYKSARHDGSSRPAHVTDAPAGGDDGDDDAAAAAAAPSSSSSLPSDFFDAPAEDEEGGRFFGSGVSEKQSEILDFMEEQEQAAEPEKTDAAWLRKKALAFERLITKNAEMRAKFEDEAHKYAWCGQPAAPC